MPKSTTHWALTLVALGSLQASAIEIEEGKLSLNGFAAWAYGASDNNDFHIAQHSGHFDSGEFGLALTDRLSDRAVVAAQLRFAAEDGGLFLDWAFGEWRFSDPIRLRIGVIKHPFGIFGEVANIGTLRPFFLFPSGAYGLTDVSGSGVQGASIGGTLPSAGGWEMSYDLYCGALELRVQDVLDKVVDPAALKPGGTLPIETEKTKYIAGMRLVIATPVEGLEARLSGYGSPIRQTEPERLVVGPSLQYTGERFSARAEYFFAYEANYHRAHTAYLEAAYFLTPHFQVGGRAEIYRLIFLQKPVDSPLFEHREIAATFNYWFDPNLVAKLSFHAVDGNRFAQPILIDDAILNGTLKRRTLATILGMQFSF